MGGYGVLFPQHLGFEQLNSSHNHNATNTAISEPLRHNGLKHPPPPLTLTIFTPNISHSFHLTSQRSILILHDAVFSFFFVCLLFYQFS